MVVAYSVDEAFAAAFGSAEEFAASDGVCTGVSACDTDDVSSTIERELVFFLSYLFEQLFEHEAIAKIRIIKTKATAIILS